MMLNSEIVKLYQDCGRKRCKFVELVTELTGASVDSCKRNCNSWLKRFHYRWSTSRSKARFYADHETWLDSPFEVRMN